ncbi:serine/threonine-protein kinase [Actinomadura rupiterrae]|uniref:serine/threonine-protein kinase n=1 Tax=Actinomadura rupiterrae TaxID=559627 RepID=UPI0020A3E9F2|nr:serine/threonine-protein kinase [Actinomadura rupiterrae]MCP2341703.1 serine/threonine protein kinase [Actinomadura rupiterrae]
MDATAGSLDPLGAGDPGSVGPYPLLARLGAGSMGRVYLGRSAAGRLVAVKTVHAGLADDPDFRERFAREVGAVRRVSGVYTAPVVAADADAPVPWLATAFVPAPSLERLIRAAGPLPVDAVRWLGAGCAEALESIHEAGLVHRDLKPSNVLVALDGPRVIDFGLARAAERAQMTLSRATVGTPAFMAPEQARGTREVTAASDVYSLGATLLFAATGHGPYPGRTVLELVAQLLGEDPDLAGLPTGLAELVGGCLARAPRARPTPAEIVAMVAPALRPDAGADSARAYLPSAALAVVDAHRAGPVVRLTQPSRFTDARHGGAGTDAPSSRRGTNGTDASFSRRGTNGTDGSFSRRGTNGLDGRRRPGALALPVTAAVIAAALIGVGALFGRYLTPGDGPPKPGERGPVLARQSDGDPPPPLGGEGDQPGTAPKLVVNQPHGDGSTTFVVHGSGWRAGEAVRLTLDGSHRAPLPCVADRRGTFNYAVNQEHEFVTGALPPGKHRVTAVPAAPGERRGTAVTVWFTVLR